MLSCSSGAGEGVLSCLRRAGDEVSSGSQGQSGASLLRTWPLGTSQWPVHLASWLGTRAAKGRLGIPGDRQGAGEDAVWRTLGFTKAPIGPCRRGCGSRQGGTGTGQQAYTCGRKQRPIYTATWQARQGHKLYAMQGARAPTWCGAM